MYNKTRKCTCCSSKGGWWETRYYTDEDGKPTHEKVWVECDCCNGSGYIDEDN